MSIIVYCPPPFLFSLLLGLPPSLLLHVVLLNHTGILLSSGEAGVVRRAAAEQGTGANVGVGISTSLDLTSKLPI